MAFDCFAVTKVGAYHLSSECNGDPGGTPMVEKIASNPSSVVKGLEVGARLVGGSRIELQTQGVYLFSWVTTRLPVDAPLLGGSIYSPVVRKCYGDNTDELVALFFDQEEAVRSFNEANPTSLDQRWAHKTKEVLTAAKNYPAVFEIAPSLEAWCNST